MNVNKQTFQTVPDRGQDRSETELKTGVNCMKS